MKFINKDNTPIFDAFIVKYKDQINLNKDIDTCSSSYKDSKIEEIVSQDLTEEQKNKFLNDSPYIGNPIVNEIRRSNEFCDICPFTEEEEFALIAHEIGHFVSFDLNNIFNITDKELEEDEIKADNYAVNLGLGNAMKKALLKMQKANISTINNNLTIKRISLL